MSVYTLEEAVNSGRVFVLNKSCPKGDILITFIQPGSGKSFVAKVPKTWIPITVSDTVPLQVIQDSVDFRSYLISKMLILVPKDEAEKILESQDAKDEVERIYSSKHVEEDSKSAQRRKKRQELLGDDADDKEDEVNIQDFIKEENLLVKDILERNVDNKVSVTLNELKSIEDELSKSDLVYVIKNTEGKIRSWAERQLGNLEN